MSTIEQVFDALHDTVLEHFGRVGVAGSSSVIAFEPGTPIPDQTFRLEDAARTLSPALARDFISAHADTLPEVIDSLFSRRMLTVENQYGVLLAGATAAAPAAMDMLDAVKRRAAEDYGDDVPALQPGMGRYRPLQATPANWYDLSADDNWTTISIGAADDPPPPPAGPRPGRSAVLTTWQTLPVNADLVVAKPLDIQLFDAAKTPPATSLRVHEPAMLRAFVGQGQAPAAAARVDARWLRQIEAGAPPAPARLRARVTRRAGLTRVGGRTVVTGEMEPPADATLDKRRLFTADRLAVLSELVRANATPEPVATDSLSISFRLCLVQLQRPWLSQSLLSLPGWYLPGFAKASLSDAVSLTAPMALVPTGCILIRDLQINGQWTDGDRQALARSASLGPLSLLGRDLDAGTATIRVTGMQSIGWLCERMPVLPPAGDPSTPSG